MFFENIQHPSFVNNNNLCDTSFNRHLQQCHLHVYSEIYLAVIHTHLLTKFISTSLFVFFYILISNILDSFDSGLALLSVKQMFKAFLSLEKIGYREFLFDLAYLYNFPVFHFKQRHQPAIYGLACHLQGQM